MAPRHFLDIADYGFDELRAILRWAILRKAAGRGEAQMGRVAADAVLAMIFDKPSTRTRVSFDVAMRRLGGTTIMLNSTEMQLGRGESVADTARVLSRYVDAIMLRTGAHENLVELAANAEIPVINGLTDRSHPCQVMADIMTFEERKGSIVDARVAWVGDGNNVARSWMEAAARFTFSLAMACPDALRPDAGALDWVRREGGGVTVTSDPIEAVQGADCVVTDVWVSMGDTDPEERREMLRPFQVNADVMAAAARDALFMHCLPAHRGDEVTGEVIDGPSSVVFDEAENRLHAQAAILAWCFEII